MSDDKGRRDYGSTSGRRQNKNNEQRAKEQAYQEYLRLRENRSSDRGHYVKDDDLYGAYFQSGKSGGNKGTSRGSSLSGNDYYVSESKRARRSDINSEPYRSGSSVDNTPYGNSQMRKQRHRADLERERYLEERARGKKSIARPGRKNKDDMDIMSGDEKKAAGKFGKRRKNGRGLKVALLVVLILVLGIGGVIAAGFTVVKNTLDNVGRVELDPDMIGINPQVDSDLRNYRNIALLGIDARDMTNDQDVRSDAIIVASINKETNEIKMFSVYRDTYLDLGDDVGLDKVTHSYYYGGPTKVLYSLNKNLDLNIKEVVVVNWKSVADTVDALGGLDI